MYRYKEGTEKKKYSVDKGRGREGKKNRGGSEQPSDKTMRMWRHTERNNNNYIL